jgi:lecithin-cholesterol acyltransferase
MGHITHIVFLIRDGKERQMKHFKLYFQWITLLAVLLMSAGPASAQAAAAKPLTPIIVFPGWAETAIQVIVHNQTVAPECPRSGSFEYTYFPTPSPEFSQVCMNKLLTMVYHFDPKHPGARPQPMNQPGVQVIIKDYGKTESGPHYEALYAFLEEHGYTRNVNIRVAGNDFRLTPNLGGFLDRTVQLVEATYRENHNTPVHLVGLSNGPNFTQYLLTHTSQGWKNKYIQGFTALASNLPGAGGVYFFLFTGFDMPTVSFPTDPEGAATSAAMYESLPATYMSANDPAYFKDHEIVLRLGPGGKEYTPQDVPQLFKDAGLKLAQKIAPYYWGIPKFLPPYFPNVDTYVEKGSGLPTAVGVELTSLKVGQVLGDTPTFIFMDGDSVNEDLTADAVLAWKAMPCYRFEYTDNPGLDHLSFGFGAPAVWQRLVEHANQPRTICGKR